MANEMVVLQGKSFSVDLQSMLNSSNYGWSLTGLPKGVVLLGTTVAPTCSGVAPVVQTFWFGAISATDGKAELEFTMVKFSDLTVTSKKHTISVKVIPSDSEEFAKFAANADAMADDVRNSMQPYGYPFVAPSSVNMAYGYPYRRGAVAFKYGYPDANDVNFKYGYPCGAEDVNFKYGYPCGVQDANLKYGYPCGVQDANLKYGYPCGLQETVVKYGFPCDVQNTNYKYGYPCGVQDANLKYGFPCDSSNC